MNQSSSTTVCLFLRAPERGKVKTRLAASLGEAAALRIYRALAERQLSRIPSDWTVEVHHFSGYGDDSMRTWLGDRVRYFPQRGHDLGERLANAQAEAFARGAQRVLLIGGDCPELSEARLRQAASTLEVSEVVIFPAADGGYVLLGSRLPTLALFSAIDWGSSRVCAQTLERARQTTLSLVVGETLRDVDTAEDWAIFRAEFGDE